jgi:hypothetical protein
VGWWKETASEGVSAERGDGGTGTCSAAGRLVVALCGGVGSFARAAGLAFRHACFVGSLAGRRSNGADPGSRSPALALRKHERG